LSALLKNLSSLPCERAASRSFIIAVNFLRTNQKKLFEEEDRSLTEPDRRRQLVPIAGRLRLFR
jgi:hypothetical protein